MFLVSETPSISLPIELIHRHSKRSVNLIAKIYILLWTEYVLQLKTELHFDLGDYARARALFCDALRIRRDLGLQRDYAYSFEFIADVNEMEKRYEDAVQLLAAADTLRVRIGAPVEQVNQEENENALTRLRAQLGDVVFELAWSKGATMTTEQAIALALS